MSEYAVLGPVDPQLGSVSGGIDPEGGQSETDREVEDQTLILADQAEKAMSPDMPDVRELLAGQVPPQARRRSWPGCYLRAPGPTTTRSLSKPRRNSACPLRSDIPSRHCGSDGLYPQPVRRQPTVEYLPQPRRFEGASRGPLTTLPDLHRSIERSGRWIDSDFRRRIRCD